MNDSKNLNSSHVANEPDYIPVMLTTEYIVNAKLVALGTKGLHKLVASELEVKDPTEEEKKSALADNEINQSNKVSPE